MTEVSVIDAWTGQRATQLQAAMRLSNEDFAEHLGISARAVAGWHANPAMRPHPESQQLLDAALERASYGDRQRFELLMNGAPTTVDVGATPQTLYAALSIVQKDDAVLLVRRRDSESLRWQFPAGIVKPGAPADAVAVHETLAETGVHCMVRSQIGSRLHPVTGVYCVYFHCDYLTGDAENRDVVENLSVTWAPISNLTRFIPADQIYPPILEALGATNV